MSISVDLRSGCKTSMGICEARNKADRTASEVYKDTNPDAAPGNGVESFYTVQQCTGYSCIAGPYSHVLQRVLVR